MHPMFGGVTNPTKVSTRLQSEGSGAQKVLNLMARSLKSKYNSDDELRSQIFLVLTASTSP